VVPPVPVAPFIVTAPQGETNFVGRTATLSVMADGYPLPNYQWQQNSANLSGATASRLVLTNLAVSNAGSYQVVVSNSVNSITSTPVTLEVDVPVTNIIYQDMFSGAAGPLNGRTPDTVGVGPWAAASVWSTTGSAATVIPGSAEAGFLPFVPVAGRVYTLSANIDDPAGGNSWGFLGYCGLENTGYGYIADPGSSMYGYGWELIRPDGSAYNEQAFIGPYGNGGVNLNGFFSTGSNTYAIILDTTLAQWTFTFLIGGVVAQPATASGGVPAFNQINYVTIGTIGDPVVVQDFLLTEEVPAPSPSIIISVSGGQTIVTWSAGILQSASQVNGPWSEVNGATSPYTVSLIGQKQYFRAKQ
jgi:hypothetical protein